MSSEETGSDRPEVEHAVNAQGDTEPSVPLGDLLRWTLAETLESAALWLRESSKRPEPASMTSSREVLVTKIGAARSFLNTPKLSETFKRGRHRRQSR